MKIILGISAYYHDAAAAIIIDGKVVAAAEEERFSRIKHDSQFPLQAIQFCLNVAKLKLHELDGIVFYEKPIIKFERILETALHHVPKGFLLFRKALPQWLNSKLNLRSTIQKELKKIDAKKVDAKKIYFSDHHLSHAASAYYPSGFNEAAILTIDGVGEWSTLSIGKGIHQKIDILKTQEFPHSLGLLYSCFTHFLGFKMNEGEYKLMGLSPYGQLENEETKKFIQRIEHEFVTIFDDGSFKLNLNYFTFTHRTKPFDVSKWEKLLGIKLRTKTDELKQCHANLALAIQLVTEKIILRLANTALKITGQKNLVLAGGVALNCVANGKLIQNQLAENCWIQPAPGDNGCAIGAALALYHLGFENPLVYKCGEYDSTFGNSFSSEEIIHALNFQKILFKKFENETELNAVVRDLIIQNKILGWVKGKMEFGPRALGNRSIIASPKFKENQMRINKHIKKREDFRPFAPAMLPDEAKKYFDFEYDVPFMQYVVKIKDEFRYSLDENMNLSDKIRSSTSTLEAVTHIDYSARVQIISKQEHPFFNILKSLQQTGEPGIILNTSFNSAGEPLVCSLQEILNTYLSTALDGLVIENFLIIKN